MNEEQHVYAWMILTISLALKVKGTIPDSATDEEARIATWKEIESIILRTIGNRPHSVTIRMIDVYESVVNRAHELLLERYE